MDVQSPKAWIRCTETSRKRHHLAYSSMEVLWVWIEAVELCKPQDPVYGSRPGPYLRLCRKSKGLGVSTEDSRRRRHY